MDKVTFESIHLAMAICDSIGEIASFNSKKNYFEI
jgi:hypothetical protein